jgi:ABC-type branched-subunit amino acid transport system substrate-binding protein
MHRFARVFVGFCAVAAAGCYALRSTSTCEVDQDCERGTICSEEGSYCRAGGPIRIGLLLPSTGNQSARAPERLLGLRFGQWIVERDPDRRPLGRGLELVIDDTLSTPDEAGRAAARLVRKNIVALIGPGASAEVIEAQRVSFAERILHIAPTAGAAAVGEAQGPLAERYLFSFSSEISDVVRAFALFLGRAERPAAYDACYDGLAAVVSDDVTGASYEKALLDLMPNNCVPITRTVRTPAGKKADYTAEVDALLAANNGAKKTRCVFLSTRADVAGELLRTLKSRERTSTEPPYSAFFGSSLLNDPSFFDEAKSPVAGEPSLAEGFFGVDSDPASERATARDMYELFEQYKVAHPEVPSDTTLVDRDISGWAEAIILVALAIELAGTASDAPALRDALLDVAQPGDGDLLIGPKQMDVAFARIRAARREGRRAQLDYRGAESNYDFNARGFVRRPTQVWRAMNGSIQQRWAPFAEDQLSNADRTPGAACSRKAP